MLRQRVWSSSPSTLGALHRPDDAVADLAFDHQPIVTAAVDQLRTLNHDHSDPLG